MNSQWFRYAVIAAFACVLGALAHAGISAAMQSQNGLSEATGPQSLDRQFPGLETRLTSQSANQSSKKLQNTLLQKLWDVIDAAEDLSSDEKSDARAILEEADPVLARIKKDNERAMQILRNPPRRVVPKPPAQPTDGGEKQASAKSPAQKNDGNE